MLLWSDMLRLVVAWFRGLWAERGAARNELCARSAEGNARARSLEQTRRYFLLPRTPPAHSTHRHPSHGHRTPTPSPFH